MESVGVNINGETNVPREKADIIAALNPWRDLNGTRHLFESRLVFTGNRNRFVYSMNRPEFPIQGIFYLEDIFHLEDLQNKNNHHLLPRIGYRGDRQSLLNNMRGNLERFNHYIKN